MENEYLTLYVKVFSEGEWFGGFAPVPVVREWLRPDGRVGLFTIQDNDLAPDDEYEHFQSGTQVLGYRKSEDWFSALESEEEE